MNLSAVLGKCPFLYSALLSVMLSANAAPGDFCRALSDQPVELAKVQAAVDTGESVDSVGNNSPGSLTSAFRMAAPTPDVAIHLIPNGANAVNRKPP